VVEPGETRLDEVIREVREERVSRSRSSCDRRISPRDRVQRDALFHCSFEDGEPALPAPARSLRTPGSPPDAIPPRSNLPHHALADIVVGRLGIARDGLPRIN
jgi:hypothetical protein